MIWYSEFIPSTVSCFIMVTKQRMSSFTKWFSLLKTYTHSGSCQSLFLPCRTALPYQVDSQLSGDKVHHVPQLFKFQHQRQHPHNSEGLMFKNCFEICLSINLPIIFIGKHEIVCYKIWNVISELTTFIKYIIILLLISLCFSFFIKKIVFIGTHIPDCLPSFYCEGKV